jgi:hypothetical protein
MGKLLKLAALLALVPALLVAGGETGADILKEKTGIRAVAMGGAYTAAADDVEALNYNPAGIAAITKKELELFGFFSGLNYAGLNTVCAAFAQPFESPLIDGFAGVSAVYRGIPPIDNEGATDPVVNYYDMALTGTYACGLYQFFKDDFYKAISLGVSAKIIIEQIGVNSISSIAFDAGAIYALTGTGFKFGVSLMNAGFPISAKRGDALPTDPALTTAPLPMTLRLGAAYKLSIDKNNSALFSADYIHDFYEAGQAAIGAEYSLLNMLFLRLGYNMSTDLRNPAAISAGAGISIPTTVPIELTIELNYAYRLMLWDWFNAPDSTHAISLGIMF